MFSPGSNRKEPGGGACLFMQIVNPCVLNFIALKLPVLGQLKITIPAPGSRATSGAVCYDLPDSVPAWASSLEVAQVKGDWYRSRTDQL